MMKAQAKWRGNSKCAPLSSWCAPFCPYGADHFTIGCGAREEERGAHLEFYKVGAESGGSIPNCYSSSCMHLFIFDHQDDGRA